MLKLEYPHNIVYYRNVEFCKTFVKREIKKKQYMWLRVFRTTEYVNLVPPFWGSNNQYSSVFIVSFNIDEIIFCSECDKEWRKNEWTKKAAGKYWRFFMRVWLYSNILYITYKHSKLQIHLHKFQMKFLLCWNIRCWKNNLVFFSIFAGVTSLINLRPQVPKMLL